MMTYLSCSSVLWSRLSRGFPVRSSSCSLGGRFSGSVISLSSLQLRSTHWKQEEETFTQQAQGLAVNGSTAWRTRPPLLPPLPPPLSLSYFHLHQLHDLWEDLNGVGVGYEGVHPSAVHDGGGHCLQHVSAQVHLLQLLKLGHFTVGQRDWLSTAWLTWVTAQQHILCCEEKLPTQCVWRILKDLMMRLFIRICTTLKLITAKRNQNTSFRSQKPRKQESELSPQVSLRRQE